MPVADRLREKMLNPTRYTSFNPPVLSTIERESASAKPIRRKWDSAYLEYCRSIQHYGTNLITQENSEEKHRNP